MARGGPMRIAGSGPLLLVFLVLLLGASAFLLPSPQPRHQRPAATWMQAAAATTSSPLLQQLQATFPSVSIPLEFVDGIAVSDSPSSSSSSSGAAESGSSPEEQQALVRARTFASLAPRVLLARGLDTISDDFAFFSPSTGRLSRPEYMSLVSLLERALPNLRLSSAHYQIVASRPNGGAVVSFLSRAQGSFTGELSLGKILVQGTDERYKSDVELNLVAFDAEGLLQAYSTGIVVPDDAVAAALSPEALQALGAGPTKAGEGEEDEEMVDLRRRLESQTQKLGATPEGTNAWEKIKADMATMQHKLDTHQREGELVRTGGGFGGLGGVLFALGVEHAGGVVSLDGMAGAAEELPDDFSMELNFVSIPSECEPLLRDTQAAWKEMMVSS